MTIKYFVDKSGRCLGGFVDGAVPPAGAIEVPEPPSSGQDTWDGEKWIPDPLAYKAKREAAYALIGFGDQLDAIYKFALAAGLKPDPAAAVDTPEGWCGRIKTIKEQYPKPADVNPL